MYLEWSSSTTTKPKESLVSRFYALPDIEDNELEVYAIETDSMDSCLTEDRLRKECEMLRYSKLN